MDQHQFEIADPIIDQISEMVDQALTSPALENLRQALADLSKSLSPYSVSLDMNITVYDGPQDRLLPLLTTGLASSEGDMPYRTSGDSTIHRYVVDGEIQVVPHDRCPRCWGAWDFKFLNPSCGKCDATLGEEVKLLLDSDICPSCENGKVSMSNPQCEQCGSEVDPDLIVWG